MDWRTAATGPASPPLSPLVPQLGSLSISSSALPTNPDDSIPAWFLSSFNQKAQQQRRNIDWDQSSVGDNRMQSWTVNCIGKHISPACFFRALTTTITPVDGQAMGTGAGSTIKEAKLIAARTAWRLMGWGDMPTASDNGSNAG